MTDKPINDHANALRMDALMPPEMAAKAEQVGAAKAVMGGRNMFLLAVMAGAFIALGAVFATVVTTPGAAAAPAYGVVRLLGGLAFSLGLILVVVAGAELFTGNNLIIMAWASRKVTTAALIRNWAIVYAGNFVGAGAAALMMRLTGHHLFANGAVGLNALGIAGTKCSLGLVQAVALGIMCNALVCLAVWLCYSARSTADKILSIVFPISAFVASGFEHCVANMYFIPFGLILKETAGPLFWTRVGAAAADYSTLTWPRFLFANLLPVTAGNIIGGAVMVGLIYWFVYIRKPRRSPFGCA